MPSLNVSDQQLDIKETDNAKVAEVEEYDNDWDDPSQDEDWWDSD